MKGETEGKPQLRPYLPVPQHPPGLSLLVVERQQADARLLVGRHEEDLRAEHLAQVLRDLPERVDGVAV